MFRIALIGAGNVASHLAEALESAGHRITEVFSRRKKNAVMLAEKLYQATPTDKLDFTASKADVFIIAVADAALSELLHQLQLPPQAIVVHTSGTLSMNLLAILNRPHGVFYPLQTFSKHKPVEWQRIPICLEASDKATIDILAQIASDISTNVYAISSEERKQIHLAAVIACNFANHLWHIAWQILKPIGIPFHLFRPLLQETLEKAMQMPPHKVQTGPAIRGDIPVMEQHLALLTAHSPLWAEIYQLISQSIAETAARTVAKT
ncbi:MAG: DUF2520 domain-containing protein [Cytophagales bacterium]|nr:DUF2520 domain-containing protein [Bernardetiaceae bacterium]MDW8205943.1 DUF2520 domain-containing protein [Cytophagales bacterium]